VFGGELPSWSAAAVPRIDIPAIIAIAVREPVGGVMEQQRAGREWIAGEGELPRHPTDKAAALVIDALRNIRRKTGKYADNLGPVGAVFLLIGLMTSADSRKAAARRAWALLSAPLEGGGACPETFGNRVRSLVDRRKFVSAGARGLGRRRPGLGDNRVQRRPHIKVQGRWPRFRARSSHRTRSLA
jgi:hypothetical protein